MSVENWNLDFEDFEHEALMILNDLNTSLNNTNRTFWNNMITNIRRLINVLDDLKSDYPVGRDIGNEYSFNELQDIQDELKAALRTAESRLDLLHGGRGTNKRKRTNKKRNNKRRTNKRRN